jgi:hypothetical protein
MGSILPKRTKGIVSNLLTILALTPETVQMMHLQTSKELQVPMAMMIQPMYWVIVCLIKPKIRT